MSQTIAQGVKAMHPKGLYLLAFTEMWERFSYYGMNALLMNYMITEVTKGGLGWGAQHAGQVLGLYAGLVYFTPLIGGYIADSFLGSRTCILIGALFIMAGHFTLAIDSVSCFYGGIALLIIGVGFFKANISAIVGKLYPEGSPLIDSAYTVFYMGINVGSIFGILACSYVGERIGWHYGFGLAGVGMSLSFLTFYLGQKLLGDIGGKPLKQNVEATTPAFSLSQFTKIEKGRLWVIFILSLFSITFWMAWQQMSASVTIFVKEYTYRRIDFLNIEIPVGTFQALNSVFVSIMAPVMAIVWNNLGKKGKDIAVPVKIAFSLLIMAVAFLIMSFGSLGIVQGQPAAVSMWYVVAFYVFQVTAEMFQYPVSLAAVSKLSPKPIYSIMFGVYLTSLAIGNYLAGAISGYIEIISKNLSLSWFFMVSVIFLGVAGVVLLLLSPRLKKMMHGLH